MPPVKQTRTKNTKTRQFQRAMSSSSLDQEISNRRIKRSASGSEMRVSAKTANQSRTGFHETGRNFLYHMSSQIFKIQNPDGKINETREHMLKNKFVWRKEYDKLKVIYCFLLCLFFFCFFLWFA